MVYPTPGFVVRQTFLEFEEPSVGESPATAERARGLGRAHSDSELRGASKLVSLYGSEDLRLYCEGSRADAAGEASDGPLDQRLGEEQESDHAGATDGCQLQGLQEEDCTTLLLEHLPRSYTRQLLLETLNVEGFGAMYDFVYMPVDLLSRMGSGYAFVNFRSHVEARRALRHFDGFARWRVQSSDVCAASWSGFCQGLTAHIERYRNSPVMHEKVPEACKPMLLAHGAPAPFPAPTKRVRMPRMRGKTGSKQRRGSSPVRVAQAASAS